MKVLLLGATGLVGEYCLKYLLATPEVSEIIAPSRRTIPLKNQKLTNALVDFDRLDEYSELFDVDAILCCLGTTLKQAGSRRNFKKVDFQYCMDAAELGRSTHVKAFLLVSAVGASDRSPWFYSRVKGQLESHLVELEYPVLSIYRPSLLLGEREKLRLGEQAAGKLFPLLSPFLRGPLAPYKAVSGDKLAQAMVNELLAMELRMDVGPKVNLYTYDEIVKLAKAT